MLSCGRSVLLSCGGCVAEGSGGRAKKAGDEGGENEVASYRRRASSYVGKRMFPPSEGAEE